MSKRQRTIVLDLDDTCLHSYSDPDFPKEYRLEENPKYKKLFVSTGNSPVTYSFTTDGSYFWGLYRPHLFEFLDFVQEHFDNVYVWSAGVKPYVETIVENMFKKTGRRMPKMIFSRPQCAFNEEIYHKPLVRVMDSTEILNVDIKNTLILDDHTYTFINNPRNGILIPQFAPGEENYDEVPTIEELSDRSDDALLKLIKWFKSKEFTSSPDVRTLNKRHIFD